MGAQRGQGWRQQGFLFEGWATGIVQGSVLLSPVLFMKVMNIISKGAVGRFAMGVSECVKFNMRTDNFLS